MSAHHTDERGDATPVAGHAQPGPRTYLVVAAFLTLLTAMEVGVFYVSALAGVLVPLLIFFAASKFALVAMYYMHLRFDHTWFAYLFLVGIMVATGLTVALLWIFGVFGTTGLRVAGGG